MSSLELIYQLFSHKHLTIPPDSALDLITTLTTTSALESHCAQCFKDKDIIVSGLLTLNTIQTHHSLIEDVDILVSCVSVQSLSRVQLFVTP